jgi:nucleotide-binding universal stress UspA family protein
MGMMPPEESIQQIWDDEETLAGNYLAAMAERLGEAGVPVATVVTEGNAAAADILKYVASDPSVAAIALCTHGRGGLGRLVFGSVAEEILHTAPVPLLLLRPEAGGPPESLAARPEFRRILVPLDGSPAAEQALEHARGLARATGATLILLSVALPPSDHLPATAPPTLIPGTRTAPQAAQATTAAVAPGESEADRITHYLQAQAEALRREGLPVETELTYGKPAAEITAVSKRVAADILVMATHGRSGLARVRLGSVALEVAQTSRLPVLLVRVR